MGNCQRICLAHEAGPSKQQAFVIFPFRVLEFKGFKVWGSPDP